MNLHQRGSELIHQLKDHVLEVLRSHPDAVSNGKGILQEEVARRAGLHSMGSAELDHTCSEMLKMLHREGSVELVDEGGQDEKEEGVAVEQRLIRLVFALAISGKKERAID